MAKSRRKASTKRELNDLESFLAHYDEDDRGNSYTASTYPACEFFSCNTAVTSVRICDILTWCWLWRIVWYWLLLANSCTQGGTTRVEKDVAFWAISILLPSWLGRCYYSAGCMWILVPRPIILSQSGNETKVNIHVGFSHWGGSAYCSRSDLVCRSACLQYCCWIVASAYLACVTAGTQILV